MTPDMIAKKIDSLTKICMQLEHALRGFELVIDKENDAIRRSDINELETITVEKTAFGIAVEDKADKIRHHIDELAIAVGMVGSGEAALQLDALVDRLFKVDNIEASPELDRLSQQVKKLGLERQRIFPKVEANAYLVKKLLQYHRETYVFWQAVASDSEAVYGKSGRAVNAPKKSILSVRT